MKKGLTLGIILLLGISLSGCGQTKEEKMLESMNKIEQTQDQMQQLTEDLENGKITEQEYEKKMEELGKKYEQQNKQLKEAGEKAAGVKVGNQIPKLVYDYGFEDPDLKMSNEGVKSTPTKDGYVGIAITYVSNDGEKIIKEAEKLAKSMNLEESKMSPRKMIEKQMKMLDMLPKQSQEEFKKEAEKSKYTTIFQNCKSTYSCDKKYLVTLSTAGENGNYKLTIIFLNTKKHQ